MIEDLRGEIEDLVATRRQWGVVPGRHRVESDFEVMEKTRW
jgi:hypothetical protein